MPIHDWSKVYAGLFHHFHQRWVGNLCDALNSGPLPAGYYALSEQVIGGPIPDLLTLQYKPRIVPDSQSERGISSAIAKPKTKYVQSFDLDAYAAKADEVVIHHPLGQVVAVVEILSPGNKHSRAALHALIAKVVGLLTQGVHVLLVDLFPPSPRDPEGIHKALWEQFRDEPFVLPPEKRLTLASYSAGPALDAYVEPVAIGDALPDMPLFFEPGRYVYAPLETTYNTTWAACPAPLQEAVIGTREPDFGK